ncbi:MAG: hypothetical protein JXR85_09620 [Deltaproteobacteria bacterium]|nr:hypothetical protein [Deltaproteobacteria bacterium]
MAIKIYQPDRKDILINTEWGIPQDHLSKDEARQKNLKLFSGRWVTGEERKQLKEQRDVYISIRAIAIILMIMPLLLSGYIVGSQPDIKNQILPAVFGISSFIGGIGLLRYRRWGRQIGTLVLAFSLALPFMPILADDKGAVLYGFLGIIGLYYLYRKPARQIFSEPVTDP